MIKLDFSQYNYEIPGVFVTRGTSNDPLRVYIIPCQNYASVHTYGDFFNNAINYGYTVDSSICTQTGYSVSYDASAIIAVSLFVNGVETVFSSTNGNVIDENTDPSTSFTPTDMGVEIMAVSSADVKIAFQSERSLGTDETFNTYMHAVSSSAYDKLGEPSFTIRTYSLNDCLFELDVRSSTQVISVGSGRYIEMHNGSTFSTIGMTVSINDSTIVLDEDAVVRSSRELPYGFTLSSGANVHIGKGSTLSIISGMSVTGATFTMNEDATATIRGQFTLSNSTTFTMHNRSTLDTYSDITLSQNNVHVDIYESLYVGSGSTLAIEDSQATLVFDGSTRIEDGSTIHLYGNAYLYTNGTTTIYGQLNIDSGTLKNFGTLRISSESLTIQKDSQLLLSSGYSLRVQNALTISGIWLYSEYGQMKFNSPYRLASNESIQHNIVSVFDTMVERLDESFKAHGALYAAVMNTKNTTLSALDNSKTEMLAAINDPSKALYKLELVSTETSNVVYMKPTTGYYQRICFMNDSKPDTLYYNTSTFKFCYKVSGSDTYVNLDEITDTYSIVPYADDPDHNRIARNGRVCALMSDTIQVYDGDSVKTVTPLEGTENAMFIMDVYSW